MLEVVCWRRNFEVKGICLQAIIGLKLIQIQHLSLSIINRSVNVEFSANLVNLLMTLCPSRVLKIFDDDQVLCVSMRAGTYWDMGTGSNQVLSDTVTLFQLGEGAYSTQHIGLSPPILKAAGAPYFGLDMIRLDAFCGQVLPNWLVPSTPRSR
jgi:hypothetical protein